MDIRLIKLRLDDGVYTYKYYPFEYCCKHLKNSSCINFVDVDMDTFDIDDGLASDVPRFCVEKKNIIQEFEGSVDWSVNYPIMYCPYCGQRIKIKVVGTKDVKSVCDLLNRTRAKLWKQCQNTNNKKEENQITEEIRRLDKRINSFWRLGDIQEIAKPKN